MFLLGACDVKFNDVSLLTKGGSKVKLSEETQTVECDQYDADVDEITTKIGIEADIPLTDYSIETLKSCIPGLRLVTDSEDPTKKMLVMSGKVGGSKYAIAGTLVLIPRNTNIMMQLTIFKASPKLNTELTFSKGEQSVTTVTFKGYVDQATGDLWALGDTTAVDAGGGE